jgi:predicted lipid-binding transport protein (Tim44 family)
VLFMTQESAAQYGSRASGRAGRATAGLGLGLIAAAIGALFFAAVGAFTLWLGVTDFRKKKPQSDDSWKDMPYPKG